MNQWVRIASASVIAVAIGTVALQAIAGNPVGGPGYVLLGGALLAAVIARVAQESSLALGIATLLLTFSATLLLLGGVGFLLLPAVVIYALATLRASRDRRGLSEIHGSRSSPR